jgi:adenylate cyclase
MPEERRKLAALMFTDIVGYTALAQNDESLALELLEEHNKLLRQSFASHGGREIKSTGDGFLVEFASPVRSVQCALEIQSECERRNADADRKRRFQVRIGIHLGDIVHRGEDVFGDGVNVASRIEPLAQPGGICITRQVHDQVWNKVSARFESLGAKELKNLRTPVEVFRMVVSADQRGQSEQDRTRIAVLPLVNISPDPSDEYFADGMTEELIYTLSKISGLHVIAQTSSMRYKNSDKSVGDIGRELNIGSVLEGSVRKAGDSLRITMQLINVRNQEHVWSERYDRELKDVFAIQSDISECVAEALKTRLLAAEREGVSARETENPDAYAFFLKGQYHSRSQAVESLTKAGECFQRAIDLDPGYARAYGALAGHYYNLGVTALLRPKTLYEQARTAAQKALELDGENLGAHCTLGMLRLLQDGDSIAAEEELQLAVSEHPNVSGAHGIYGLLLMCLARPEEALTETERAIELDPVAPVLHRQLGLVFYSARRYEEAIDALQECLELDPDFLQARFCLGAVHLARGKPAEALKEFELETKLPKSLIMPAVGISYVELGRRDEAQRLLEEATEEAKISYASRVPLAMVSLALGDEAGGFRYLEEAYEECDLWLRFAKAFPFFDRVRSHPRFTSLLERMGLC